jgi:hypothetical protein
VEARALADGAAEAGGGRVDPAVLERWGVSEAQFRQARALVPEIKRDVRALARSEADNLGGWLSDRDLGELSRPTRLKQRTDLVSGGRRSVRTESGYDFIEQLDDAELARVRRRFTDSDLFPPDVVAEQVRRVTNLDLTDDEAMDWLVERWLQEDGLRSVASGRVPKYANAENLIPGDFAQEGYQIERLFGTDLDDAAGHVAAVQRDGAKRFAARVLGDAKVGPAPWEMDAGDFVRELEEVEDILSSTQVSAGVDPGPGFRWAQQRIRELAPRDIDVDGVMSPVELFEQIRLTAVTAGRL